MALVADVLSSEEARCVAPAGARGAVVVEVSTSWEGQVLSAAELSTSSKQFTYASEVSMVSVAPVVGSVEGGTVVSSVVHSIPADGVAWCTIDTSKQFTYA